jgi:HEAT repeat protein
MFRRQPKDPAERVRAALDLLAKQHRENNQRRVGLMNLPQYQRTKQELVRMGSEAVPALLQALRVPRASSDTPQGEIDDGVANDVAEVLGDIGDPRAVGPLMSLFPQYIVSAQAALARFPQGVAALLGGLDDTDEFIRSCCIQGLGVATVERGRAVQGITKALDDPYPANRRAAALAAWQLGVADPQLVTALRDRAAHDDSERVRSKAGDALRQLGQA